LQTRPRPNRLASRRSSMHGTSETARFQRRILASQSRENRLRMHGPTALPRQTRSRTSQRTSFSLTPYSDASFFVVFDEDLIRTATHRTILNILLPIAGRRIEWNHDLFAAGVANVRGFTLAVFHALDDSRSLLSEN